MKGIRICIHYSLFNHPFTPLAHTGPADLHTCVVGQSEERRGRRGRRGKQEEQGEKPAGSAVMVVVVVMVAAAAAAVRKSVRQEPTQTSRREKHRNDEE